MRGYRHDATRLFGVNRWACVGESGVFVDPLYSPGSDFIGIGNSMVAELIDADLGGAHEEERVEELNRFMLAFAELTKRTTVLGSMVFGKPEPMAAKLYWDYFQYWGFVCQYFFQRIYRLPPDEHRRFTAMLERYTALNEKAQRVLRAWAEVAPVEPSLDHVQLPLFPSTLADLHLALQKDKSAEETYADMEATLQEEERIVSELVLRTLRAAGPALAGQVAEKIGLSDWTLAIDEARLDADEAAPRVRRKLLPKEVRDMERAIGKSAPAPDAPKLRQLLALVQPG